MNLDEIICSCLGVTKGMIKEAVDSGASTFEEVQAITNVGEACGICIDDAKELIEQLVKERNN